MTVIRAGVTEKSRAHSHVIREAGEIKSTQSTGEGAETQRI